MAVPSATSAYGAGSGSGGGGGGGGEETTVTNNLSVPVILVGDNPFGLDCGTVVGEPGPYTAPSGEPSTGYPIDPEAYYYVQGTNTWQAQCESALTATATIDWGDNLSGDAALVVGHPIRVEVGLIADSPPSMTGLTVVKLDPAALDRDSAYGTLATQSGSSYTANPETPFSVVRVWDSAASMVITDPAGREVPGVTIAGEVNATGTVVYGFQLTPDMAGTYTITFSTSSAVTVTGNTSITFNVTSSSGSSGGTTTVPGAPTSLVASPTSGAVNLAWTAPADVGTGTFYGYNVYMGTAPGAESTTPVNTSYITGSTFSASGLTNGTPYYFIVKAVSSAGVSAASNEASATPGAVTPTTTPTTTPTGTNTGTLPSGPTSPTQSPISPSSTLVKVSASPEPSGVGQAVVYSAVINPVPKDGGTVNFISLNTDTSLSGCSAVPVVNGRASCSITHQTAGAYDVIAVFSGTATVPASRSAAMTHNVQSPTGLVLTASPTTVAGAKAVTYTVKMSGAALGGTVLITSGHRLVCTIQLDSNGQGQCTSTRSNGNGMVTATYVGDATHSTSSATVKTSVVPASYWVLGSNGNVFRFGSAGKFGTLPGHHVRASNIAEIATAPDGQGYWIAGRDGAVYAFGSAHFYGSLGNKHLKSPIVGMSATPDGQGYWLVSANGTMYRFGDAKLFGSLANRHIASPIVGMTATPDGQGYWLVSSNGSMYRFGDAKMFGSMAGKKLASPAVGMVATSDGKGYWIFTSKGAVSRFGNAKLFGSLAGKSLSSPVVAMASTPDSRGYWLVTQNGHVYNFGSAANFGSARTLGPGVHVVGIAVN